MSSVSLGIGIWSLITLPAEARRIGIWRLIILVRLSHIIELLAYMAGRPDHRNQEAGDKPVKQVD